ncbi:YopX family protein, partial [Streptococcus sanguinis]|uniref:YopX family protein n=1 Tax=Streptococcus sanguinis TaxID=1305 RepID=UPI001D158C0C
NTVGQSTGFKDQVGREIFEGDIIRTNSFACIVGFGRYNYFEDNTVGQSTGFKDQVGREIFEGDIIRTNSFACIVGFGRYNYFEDDEGSVIESTGFGFYLEYLNVTPATCSPFELDFVRNCKVLGNIYDNSLDLIMYAKSKQEKLNDTKI